MSQHFSESMEVVINRCYGGFGLSRAGIRRLLELGYKLDSNEDAYIAKIINDDKDTGYFNFAPMRLLRHDQRLVQVVRELGDAANGDHSKLRIETVYYGYNILGYDGMERIE